MENASDIWNTFKKCYYQGDVFRISDLQEEIYLVKQGDANITTYFTKLKGLIQELDNFRLIPSCTCAVVCSCELILIIKSYREGDYVIRFLRGLNEQYSTVRSNIMMMDPLPDLDKVFYILIQQQRQLVLQFDDSRVFAQLDTNNGTYGRGRGRGGHTSGGKGRGRSTKICTYCNKSSHMVDTCYKKHGYPPHLHR